MNKLNILILCCVYVTIGTAKVFQINVCDGENNTNSTFLQLQNREFYFPLELRPDAYFSPKIILTFNAIKHQLECHLGSFTVSWTNGLENITNAEGKRIKMPDLIISPSGYIKYKNQVYDKNQFCLSEYSEDHVKFQVCNNSCSENSPCIYKCCEPDEVINIERFPDKMSCKRSRKDKWHPVLFSNENNRLSSEDIRPILNTRHQKNFGSDGCKIETLTLRNIGNHKRSQFRILSNGSILVKNELNNWALLTNEMYCVDGIHNFSVSKNYTTGDEEINTVLAKCVQENYADLLLHETKQLVDIVYGSVLAICSFFLLLTLLVYIFWKTHNVHTLTQLFYISSLFCAYVFLATTRFTSVFWKRTDVVSNACRVIGIFAHFFYLSTFTWLSVVNLDIWLTFRKIKLVSWEGGRGKKLLLYSLFAEGIPFLIVAAAVSVDLIYEDDIEMKILPQYGKKNCFLDLHVAQLYYLFIPIGVLLIANVIFFALTVWSLYFVQKSTKFASNTRSTHQMKSIKLYAKLFLIMGVPWFFDFASYMTTTDYDDVKWYWVISDILLCCQSLAIFLTFCQDERRRLANVGSIRTIVSSMLG